MQVIIIITSLAVQLHTRYFGYIISFNLFKQLSEIGLIIISILQMRWLKDKSVYYLAQDHTVNDSCILNLGLYSKDRGF